MNHLSYKDFFFFNENNWGVKPHNYFPKSIFFYFFSQQIFLKNIYRKRKKTQLNGYDFVLHHIILLNKKFRVEG